MTIKIIGLFCILFVLFTSGKGKIKSLRILAILLFSIITLFIIYQLIPPELLEETKPCYGICGFKLGEKVDYEKLYDNCFIEYGTGQRDYLVKDFKNFMDFNTVYVSLLKNGSIYQIGVEKNNTNKDFYEKVLNTIENHYKITKDRKEKHKNSVIYQFPNKITMIIEYHQYDYISILITSSELMKQFNDETTQNNVDTSALE